MKYYYDDPLEAAWMVREFNFSYGRKIEGKINYYFLDENDCLEFYCTDTKFYLAPDFYPLLLPQVGDLVKSKSGKTADTIVGNIDGIPKMTSIDTIEEMLINEDEIIVQRQGKAWFTPKVEE